MLGPVLSVLPMFIEALKRAKTADVIVCQYHPHHFVPVIGVLVGKIVKRPVVARACDVYRDMGGSEGLVGKFVRVSNAFNESNIRHFSAFLVCCSDFRNILLSRKPDYSSKVNLLFNGFDSEDFQNLPSKQQVRKSLHVEANEKMVVFIGRFSGDEYGTEVLLKGFSILLNTFPKAILFLIGDKLSSNLTKTIELLGLERNVRVYGAMPHSEVVKFIVGSDVCIGPLMPTQTIPLKVIEYMACNKQIVTGRGSVSRDLGFKDDFIITNPTAKEISAAISKALLVRESKDRVCDTEVFDNFSWQNLSAELEHILFDTVKSHRDGLRV